METVDYAAIINRNAVAVNVPAENKEAAFQYIAEMLDKDGVLTSIDGFKKDLYLREEMGKTGIGGGVAIPHGKSRHVVKTCISIVKLAQPIAWESADDKPVEILILFAVNEADKTNTFLRMMAQVARKLAQEGVSARLRAAKTPDDLVNALLDGKGGAS